MPRYRGIAALEGSMAQESRVRLSRIEAPRRSSMIFELLVLEAAGLEWTPSSVRRSVGLAPQASQHVLTRHHADQPLPIRHGKALHTRVNHLLEHAGRLERQKPMRFLREVVRCLERFLLYAARA